MPKMQILFATGLLAWVASCSGDGDDDEGEDTDTTPEDEDCNDGVDNDDDGDTDCDDSDCAGDAACDTTPTAETDCSDEVDEDEDGYTDCLDADCASSCFVWVENGTATVVPEVSYDGTAEWVFDLIDYSPICTYNYDVSSTASLTTCDGCDFAFTVQFDNATLASGDCTPLPAEIQALLTTSSSYEYGFDSDYDYAGTPIAAFMYGYGGSWYALAEATFVDGQFDYQVLWAYSPL